MSRKTTLSVLVPVRYGAGDPLAACAAARQAFLKAADTLEFVVILDGPAPELEPSLLEWKASGERLRVIRLARRSGEAAALKVALGFASGSRILILPADLPVDPADLPAMVAALDDHDLVVAARPRGHGKQLPYPSPSVTPAPSLLGLTLRESGCGVRAGRREVFEEIPHYGGDDRFLPVFADRLGFRVAAMEVRPREGGGTDVTTRNRGHAGGLLDLLAVFFLTRFSRKPLRFFGLLGAPLFGAGMISLIYLLYIKFVHAQPLANRPLLLLAVLLLVLGAQVIALGLVAEIIVFTHLRDVQEYSVEEVTD